MAFQRTDPNHEEFVSRQGSRCTDSSMMDEILALLLQDHSSSDEEKKNVAVVEKKPATVTKDCGIPGQHCNSEEGESVEAHSPPFSAVSEPRDGLRHSIRDISSMMVRQTVSVRMDFASIFRTQPPLTEPSGPSLPASVPRSSSEALIVELNDAEFENLKKRMRTQEASRRYRRRKKVPSSASRSALSETLRQQKSEIQELRSELARLHSIEADIEVMDQQSPTTVLREFDAHAQKLHERLDEARTAAEAELAMIRSIQDHLLG